MAQPPKGKPIENSEQTRLFGITAIFILSIMLYILRQPALALFGMVVFAVLLDGYTRDTIRDPREAAFLKLVDRLPERCTIVRKVDLTATTGGDKADAAKGGKGAKAAKVAKPSRGGKRLTAEVVVTASGLLLLVADDHKGVISVNDHVWQSELGKKRSYIDSPVDDATVRQKGLRSLLSKLSLGTAAPIRTYVVFTDPKVDVRVPREQNGVSVRTLTDLGDELQRPLSGKLSDEQMVTVAEALRATRKEQKSWARQLAQRGKK